MLKTNVSPEVAVRNRVPIPLKCCEQTGTFFTFRGLGSADEHFAIKLGPDTETPLVRVHSECVTGDLFGSMLCDCGEQLKEAIEEISREGGYLIYLRQEGRGIGLYAKLDTYVLQARGKDTFEANRALGFADDLRTFEPAAEMLKALGVESVFLMTNNPEKVADLESYGVQVREMRRTGVYSNEHNYRYLMAKAKARHAIDLSETQIPNQEEVK